MDAYDLIKFLHFNSTFTSLKVSYVANIFNLFIKDIDINEHEEK